jgi:hypothetical protein
MPKKSIKRFGMVAVEKGYVDQSQVIEALKTQVQENMNKKEHRPVGLILAAMGLITKAQIDEILKSLAAS